MEKKTYTEELAEELARLPEDQREFVAAHLLGIAMGMRLGDDVRREEKSA